MKPKALRVTVSADNIKEMKDWLKECYCHDEDSVELIDELTPEETMRQIDKEWCGGVSDFLINTISKVKADWEFDDET